MKGRWHCTAPCFQATWKGTPLDRLQTKKGSQGFNWLFKLRTVARWRGLTWEHFRMLEIDDQAGYVAEYEIAMKFDYLEAMDRLRKQRRANKGKR
jgi:hypothetical protein